MPPPSAPRKKGTLSLSTTVAAATAKSVTAKDRVVRSSATASINSGSSSASSSNAASSRPTTSTSRTSALKSGFVSAAPTQTPLQKVASASATINNTLKAFGNTRSTASQPSLKTLYSDAKSALAFLRGNRELVEPRKRLEIEKAALVLVGHCIENALYDLALEQLKALRASLISLYAPQAIVLPASSLEESLSQDLEALSLTAGSSSKAVKAPRKLPSKSLGSSTQVSPEQAVKDALSLLSFPDPARTTCTPDGEASVNISDLLQCLITFGYHLLACVLYLSQSGSKEGTRLRFRLLAGALDPDKSSKDSNLDSTYASDPLSLSRAARMLSPKDRKKCDSSLSALYSLFSKALQEADQDASLDLEDALHLKCYALECLLENRHYFAAAQVEEAENVDGSDAAQQDKPVNLVCGQLHRAAVSFCRSTTQSKQVAEAQLAGLLDQPVARVLRSMTISVSPSERLQGNKTYIDLLDFLAQVARKGASSELDVVLAKLLGGTPDEAVTVANTAVPVDPARTQEEVYKDSVRICAAINANIAKVDKWIKSDFEQSSPDAFTELGQHLSGVQQILGHRNLLAESSRTSIIKALERSFFYPARALRSSVPSPPPATASALPFLVQLLLQSVAVVEEAPWLSADLLACAVDALLLLSRKALDLKIVATYKAAYAHLARARDLLSRQETVPRSPDVARCISNTAYRIGSQLYNADKAANAIPFLRLSCEVAEKSLYTAAEVETNARQKLQAEVMEALPQQYELLGLAHAMIRDKREAMEAYRCSIAAAIRLALGKPSSCDALEQNKSFAKTVARYTKIGTLDMLQPAPEVALTPVAIASSSDLTVLRRLSEDHSMQGALLYMQIRSLEAHIGKPEAVQAISVWLAMGNACYQAADRPLRLAKNLVYQMEISARMTGTITSVDLNDAAVAIKELLACPVGLDADLASHANQYKALSRIYSGMDVIRRKDASASKIIAKEAKEALTLLRITAVGASAPSSLPSANTTSKDHQLQANEKTDATLSRSTQKAQAMKITVNPALSRTTGKPSRTNRSAATATVRKPLSPKNIAQVSANAHVTPPRSGPKPPGATYSGDTVPASLGSAATKWISLNEPVRTLNTLTALTSLLGAFEHTFLRLGYLRLLKSLHANTSDDGYVDVCTQLAQEYMALGKKSRAASMLEQAHQRIACKSVSPGIVVMLFLREADFQSLNGDHEQALATYLSALTLWEKADLQAKGNGSPSDRIIGRSQLLYRTALAAEVFSGIQSRKGAAVEGLAAALQALRLANRAMTNLARLTQASAPESDAMSGVDCAEKVDSAGGLASASAKGSESGRTASFESGSLGWDVSVLLGRILANISGQYSIRGSVKPATFFLQQAYELALALNAPRLQAKVLSQQIDLDLAAGRHQEGQERVVSLAHLAAENGGLSTIEVMRIKAHVAAQAQQHEDAETGIKAALKALQKLDKGYADTELQIPSPQKHVQVTSMVANASFGQAVEDIVPLMHSQLLRSLIRILQNTDRAEEALFFLGKIANLAANGHGVGQEAALQAKIRYNGILAHLRRDPVLGLLQESVLTVPTLGFRPFEDLPSNLDALPMLEEVELLLLGAVSQAQQFASSEWKDLCASLARTRMLQSALGKQSPRGSSALAGCLEAGTAVALRREMLDSLNSKLINGILQEDTKWPDAAARNIARGHDMSSVWQSMETRYRRDLNTGCSSISQLPTLLPEQWVALSLHLSADQQSIIAVRYERNKQPLVLQLPLDRLGRRDSEENLLTFDSARFEMLDIVATSNDTCATAKHIKAIDDRKAWWRSRKELESRLQDLLINIEDRWFGAFKHVLTRPERINTPHEDLNRQLNTVLRKAILTTKDNRNASHSLDSIAMQCFHALDKTCTDDDLEDLLHYVVDSYQFAGVSIACDEIDVDQAVVDLRTVLDDYLQDATTPRPMPNVDGHLFLILDSNLHSFPWESMPCLAGQSVSRLPSVSFLEDRLQLRQHRLEGSLQSYPGLIVNQEKTFYALDPGGDLTHTQNEFADWLDSKRWNGVRGRAPLEEELKRGLSTNDLFLYFGHGGGEQFIRPTVIRNLQHCATVLLWGCSSGHLTEQGEYEANGTPWTYMIAGAPAVVANLWDVTDKDIDRFTKATFAAFGLQGDGEKMSLPQAVASARTSCSLRYLNGAAPVVWGIPVRLG